MASNIVFSAKKEKKVIISYITVTFWDRFIDFTDDPVVQCDVPPVKNASLDDDDNNDSK